MATSPLQSEKKPQDAAYARAQDAIATARTSGASDLTLSGDDFSDLAVLPPDIGSLTALSSLDLWGTPVSDISALSGLTALSRLILRGTPVSDISALSGLTALSGLNLMGTQVSDISALSGLTALSRLYLFGTQVSDISALSGLTALSSLDLSDTPVSDISALSGSTALSSLYLSDTQVSDISALSGLTALEYLNLSGTQVSDISALSGLTALRVLDLTGTPVSDLSPVLPLTQLADASQYAGLAFKNTVAAQADPRIAEIAEIDDNAKRATDLSAYLKNVNLTQTAQYHTLLSTRLMRASIGDFQFDSLARVMRLMPFEEDLRRLRDPVQLARFLEGAEDLCEGLQTLSTALKASSGNMYAAQITPYLDGVIDTLGRAEQSHTLNIGKVIEYGEALEDFSLDAATRAELGDPLSKDLTRQVNSLLDLVRNHFADTFLRFAPLQNIEMAPNQTPIQALAQVEALLSATRAAARDLVPLAKEDDAVFTHMMRSIEKLTRAHGQATSDSDRASYRREINYHLAMVTVSIGLYAAKARHHAGNIGPVIDRVLAQTKRVKGLQGLVEMIEELLRSSAH